MECQNTAKKLYLDFIWLLWLRRFMAHDDATHDLIARLFYLITVAAEDAATLAVEGQSRHISPNRIENVATQSRQLGEQIEILSSAIKALNEI